MLDGKRVLLIVGGGIAAYKSLDLIRQIRKAGGAVTPVLTRAAMEFITPLSASALAGEKVYTDLFDLTDEAEMGHIELSRSADILVVAPATADLAARGEIPWTRVAAVLSSAPARLFGIADGDRHAGPARSGHEHAHVASPGKPAKHGLA